jgi:fructose-bisphosphate aldolase class 1
MNRYAAAVLAVSAAAFGGQALAESPNAVPGQQFVSGKSRAEVQAELAQYKQAGVNPWATSYNPLRGFKSTASRDDVTAQYIASRDEVAAFNREDSGSAFLAQSGQRGIPAPTTLAGEPGANLR